ncbi:hypothetical protein [Formosa algae]|uniref:hypothetical protein n=1 Tax=Formosa algae TaxID=225843 RepID=UPI001553AF0F|nr:hypothetical protein [Formosa algae]
MFGATYFSSSNTLPNGKTEEGITLLGRIIKYPTTVSFLGTEKSETSKIKVKAVDSIVQNIEVIIDEEDENVQDIVEQKKCCSKKFQIFLKLTPLRLSVYNTRKIKKPF